MVVKVQEVFKISGVPTHTFVEPSCYPALKVALDSPGRGLVIEGPSGIGKSTAVSRALEDVGLLDSTTKLSARDPADVEYISLLPQMRPFGIVLVDDFHRLPDRVKNSLADLMKILADTDDESSKLLLVGINQAGQSLIEFAPDLANRIDTLRFEVEPPEAVGRLIGQGEDALGIKIDAASRVVDSANGSFYIAQMLCLELCIADKVFDDSSGGRTVATSLAATIARVMERQEGRFGKAVRTFVRGPKFRPSGRAPYLHLLRWLATSDNWSISVADELARHPKQRISVGQVVDKGFLLKLIDTQGITEILHYEAKTRVLSVEDPHLIFYLRNLDWAKFVRDSGFLDIEFEEVYDVALSFAGEDRVYADHLHNYLVDHEYAVFYDLAEQHRILAQDIEEYLGPIYESGARYVVAVLGEQYGIKRWTLFESNKFKHRVEAGQIVPIWSDKIPPSAFDTIRKLGSLTFDPDDDIEMQARHGADVIAKMLEERDRGQLPLGEAEADAAAESAGNRTPAAE